MKFNVLKSDFFEVLGYLKGIIPVNSALPMMQNFYIKASDSELTIIGTDQENTLKAQLSADIIEQGEVVLPFKFLFETVSNIPSDAMLQFSLKEDFIEINASSNIFKVVYADSREFPQPPEFTEKLSFNIGTELLSKMIKKTIFAVSTDKTNRIHLSGLNFKVLQNILNIAGTDSRRLAYIKERIDCSEEFSFTVPFETLKEVRSLCEKYDEVNIILTEDENQIIFRFKDVIYYSRLLEEEFPDYLSIIPGAGQTVLNVNTKDVKQILRMAKPIANASTIKSVRFRLENGKLYVEADAEEQGKFASSIDVDVQGDNVDINFNIDYVYQATDICDTEKMIIEFNGTARPAVVKEPENDNFIYIVMPIRG